jgi:acyl-CoA reductase-like NAD-dependent aldehyde dehydrogenase
MEATARTLDIGSAAIPEADHLIPPTSRGEMDAALAALQASKDRWVAVGIAERITLLEETLRSTRAAARRWVDEALRAKRIPPATPAEGEEWVAGPMLVLRNLRLLVESLRETRDHGAPRTPGKPFTRSNGQVVVPAFPKSIWDRVLFSGITAEIWMQREVTLENLDEHRAVVYRGNKRPGKVALVLGAGNVSSIGPMDALYKLFAEDQVVLLKMNPVNEYLGPVFADALKPLVDRDFIRITHGGAAEGQYLCRHPQVDEVHITGSDKTHDAIVFGAGEEGRRNKAARTPLLSKRITSELGNVSPIIVVPGPWTEKDFAFQAMNLASMLTNNAGFNCNATRVIVTQKSWSGREPLLEATRRVFRGAPTRFAYYPGAETRFRSFLDAHPEAERIGSGGDGKLEWMLVSGLDPKSAADICFTTEAFCSVTSEVPLDAESTVEYLRRAVDFANETLWGSLNAGILVHPKSMADPKVAAAVEQAIADLRFGSIAINQWPAISYALVCTTWGAYPGHDVYDIRSGSGVVHNTYLLEKTEKSVVRGPFRMFPKPPWFVTHKQAHVLGEKLADFEAAPSVGKLPGILWAAMRG